MHLGIIKSQNYDADFKSVLKNSKKNSPKKVNAENFYTHNIKEKKTQFFYNFVDNLSA